MGATLEHSKQICVVLLGIKPNTAELIYVGTTSIFMFTQIVGVYIYVALQY